MSRHKGQSRLFSKVGLDTKDILDLDLVWSRLLRPPGLKMILRNEEEKTQTDARTDELHRSKVGTLEKCNYKKNN